MTYENCIKYRDEATTDKMKLFWDERIKRKYPNAPDAPKQVVVKEKKVAQKPSKPVKKVVK